MTIMLKGIFKLTSEHDSKILMISVALIMNNIIMSFPTALFSLLMIALTCKGIGKMPEQTEQLQSEPSTLSSNGIISMQVCHDNLKN